jgi:hypothetical protein
MRLKGYIKEQPLSSSRRIGGEWSPRNKELIDY